MIIGQEKTVEDLRAFLFNVSSGTAILIGKENSGKLFILQELLNGMPHCVAEDNKKDTIKALIEVMYKTNGLIYVIPDVDLMSTSAMNSLLKVTEEPPNDARIILTSSSLDSVLPTLQSRSIKYYMQPYSRDEIRQYCELKGVEADKFIYDICETPGDVDKLLNNGIEEFKDYVQLVFDNIAKVSGTNALKIGSKLALKEDAEGFDLMLFLRAFSGLCFSEYLNSHEKKYKDAILVTHLWLYDLRVRGINKSALFDTWVLEIRRTLL